ncbi:MAG: hypothetical protein AABZ30_08765, partial [Myxococcota bacterium]
MGACPGCGRSIDALRARHARVDGARVVAYCSAACKAGEATGSAAAAERSADEHAVVGLDGEAAVVAAPTADQGGPTWAVAIDRRRRRWPIVLVAALLAIAVGIAILAARRSAPIRRSAAGTTPPAVAAHAPSEEPARPSLADAARAILDEYLASSDG